MPDWFSPPQEEPSFLLVLKYAAADNIHFTRVVKHPEIMRLQPPKR